VLLLCIGYRVFLCAHSQGDAYLWAVERYLTPNASDPTQQLADPTLLAYYVDYYAATLTPSHPHPPLAPAAGACCGRLGLLSLPCVRSCERACVDACVQMRTVPYATCVGARICRRRPSL
jgi:hypothetical protein